MDPARLKLITDSIKGTVDKLAGMAEGAMPQYAPAIVVGQAIIDAVPELANIVNGWTAGTPVTDEERAAVAQQIHDLVTDPENI